MDIEPCNYDKVSSITFKSLTSRDLFSYNYKIFSMINLKYLNVWKCQVSNCFPWIKHCFYKKVKFSCVLKMRHLPITHTRDTSDAYP